MSKHGIGQRTQTDVLIHRIRLMVDAGGMLTRDRKITLMDAADRLEELDERVAIMSEPPVDSMADSAFMEDWR